MTLLATETAVRMAFIITEPYLTFNWPLKNKNEMELLHREGMEVSTGNLTFITTMCLPVNHTAGFELWMRVSLRWSEMVDQRDIERLIREGMVGQLITLQGLKVSDPMFFNLNQSG